MRTGGPPGGLRCKASTGAATAIANGLSEVTGTEPKLGVVPCHWIATCSTGDGYHVLGFTVMESTHESGSLAAVL